MSNNSKGFTLIELMIVISIIGILTTMAIPTYQDRAIRAQVEEGLQLAQFVQDSVAAYYKRHRRMPANNKAAGLPKAEKIMGNYVSGINVKKGVINVRLGQRINKNAAGKIISIQPAIVKGEPKVPIAWIHGYASLPDGMTAIGENQTTILARHLPVSCRY